MILGCPSTAKASAADHCAAAGDVGLSQRGLIQSPAGGMDMWISKIDIEDMIGYVYDSIWYVYDLGWSGLKIERQPNIALTFNKQIWKIDTGMMDLESHNSTRLISSFGWGAPKVGLVNGSWGHYSISNHTDIICDILWHSTWSETCGKRTIQSVI